MTSSPTPFSDSGLGLLAHKASAWRVKGAGRAFAPSASCVSEETKDGSHPLLHCAAGPFCKPSLSLPGSSESFVALCLDARGAVEVAEKSADVDHQCLGLSAEVKHQCLSLIESRSLAWLESIKKEMASGLELRLRVGPSGHTCPNDCRGNG